MHSTLKWLASLRWDIISAIFAILGGGGAVGWITGLWKRLSVWLSSRTSRGVPRQTLRIVPLPNASSWQRGTSMGKPCLIAKLDLSITNIDDHAVSLVKANIKRPPVLSPILARPSPIPPKEVALASAFFIIEPPPKHVIGKPFIADVIVIDQYGNAHHVPRVKFRSLVVR